MGKLKRILLPTNINSMNSVYIYIYINLRRSRDGAIGRAVVWSSGGARVEFGCPRSIQFAVGSFYAVHIKALSIYENVLRKQQHTSGINMIP